MATEKSIAALIHGRYWVDDGLAGEPSHLLVGFHGYAENAEAHLEQLRRIPARSGWLICAVESLHRFYHPKTQNVIGSWMTRQGRERMISDNIRYVASVVSELRRDYTASGKLVFAGFSQGVATAYRAAAHSGFPCQGVIALAGDVPPELAAFDRLAFPPVLLGRGTQDAWYNAGKMDDDLRILRDKSERVQTCVFDGGHEWTPEFLEECGKFLISL